jgi:hypothetical protein
LSLLARDVWAWFAAGVNKLRHCHRRWLILVPLAVAAVLRAESVNGELVIQDGGQSRPFELALDELWIEGTNAALCSFAPIRDAEALRALIHARQRLQTNTVSLVLYEAGTARNEFTRRLLTRDLLIHIDPGTDFECVAEGAQVAAQRKLPLSPGWAIAHSSEPYGALALAVALRRQAGVVSADPCSGGCTK